MIKQQVLDIINHKQDHTLKEVALLTNLSVSTIRYWLREAKKQGLTIPPNQKGGRKLLSLK